MVVHLTNLCNECAKMGFSRLRPICSAFARDASETEIFILFFVRASGWAVTLQQPKHLLGSANFATDTPHYLAHYGSEKRGRKLTRV